MNEHEKDCTDQLTECHVSCEPTDKECISECIEEYHECDISKEFTSQDVEQCITDGTDYKDCVDHMVATMPNNNWKQEEPIDNEGELIAELLSITGELGGTMQRLTTLDHSGRTSKKVVIEYNVEQKEKSNGC